MDLLLELKEKGWHFSKEGLELCKEGLERVNASVVVHKALDMDIRDFGGNFFPEDMKATKLDYASGSGVVQIQKIKNATAPKYEYGSGAPPILRLLLTDGKTFVNCLQWGSWKSLSMETPPGTKLFLKPGKIPMQNNFMLLSENHFTLLGGCVAQMVEKWELCNSLASHVRTKGNLDGSGPPPWTPFGKPIISTKTKTGNFRALDQDAKEVKEDALFKQQRLANIAEIARVKEGKPKVFGGGKDVKLPNARGDSDTYSHWNNSNESSGYSRSPRNYNDYENKQSPRREDDPMTRNNRNDRNWPNQERHRPQPSFGSSANGQTFPRERRNDQRNKYNDNSWNVRDEDSYHQRPSENSLSDYVDSANKQYRDTNSFKRFPKGSSANGNPRSTDRYQNRRSNDIEDLTQKVSQVKLHGYDTQPDSKIFIAAKPFLRPGAEVMAKYWEDNKLYRAIVHAVGQEGTTCVVHFLEYGNYEEVLVNDVQQLQVNTVNTGWNAGPLSFQPSHWDCSDKSQDFPAISEFHPNSHRSHGRYQDKHKASKQDRPSAKLYQPPQQRHTP